MRSLAAHSKTCINGKEKQKSQIVTHSMSGYTRLFSSMTFIGGGRSCMYVSCYMSLVYS